MINNIKIVISLIVLSEAKNTRILKFYYQFI